MSILSGIIKTVIKPIIERKVKNEMNSDQWKIRMCGGEHKRWNTETDSEVKDAAKVGGNRRGNSARTAEAERLHRVPDQPTG